MEKRGRVSWAHGSVCTEPQSCRSTAARVGDAKQLVFPRVKCKGAGCGGRGGSADQGGPEAARGVWTSGWEPQGSPRVSCELQINHPGGRGETGSSNRE